MADRRAAEYKILASIYNHLMRSVNYSIWAEYIYSITKYYLPKSPSILELGAGTGKFADKFKRYFRNIVISDLSYPMLSLNSNKSLQKICCNITALPFKKKYDLIYSTFDTINYLTSKKKVVGSFRGIKNILKDEGIFIFDASLEKNSLKHVKQSNRKGKFKDIRFEQTSVYDKEKKIHKNIFQINLGDSNYFTEVHRQKIYSFDDYFLMADAAGLYVAECFDAFSYDKGRKNSERLQFILKRK